MAVYTRLTEAEIKAHLQNYELGELISFKEIIEGIDNSNFILETSKGRFILTIFESRIDKNELPFFMNFKLHLAKKGIHCPRPILDNQGLAIVDLKEKKSAIVTFLSGKTSKEITAKHCYEVGKTLAQLHLAAADFSMKRQNELGVFGFRALFLKFENLIEKDLREEILLEIEFLEKGWRLDLPEAAVHADLFPDNVFFDEKQNVSGVIDFYFAANDALIFDFAIGINAWCFDEENNFDEEKFAEILRGYESLREISAPEKSFLKTALRAASMRFLLTRLHDKIFTPKGSLVKIKDPQEYLEKSRFFKSRYGN